MKKTTKNNLIAFLYYLIMELAIIVWLYTNLRPEYMLILLVFFTTMDRLTRRLLTNVYTPFPILPFAALALFYEWAVPIALFIPGLLFILHLNMESKSKTEAIKTQPNAEHLKVKNALPFFQKLFHRDNYWNFLYLFVLESLMFIYYFCSPSTSIFLIVVLFLLLFFTFLQQKGKITFKSFYGFFPLLIISRYMEWAVYAAMIFPLAGFIYQMAKKEE